MKNLTVPIVKNMKATSLPKAYFLNALCMGIIAAFTIETRIMLENEKSKFSGYFNTLLSVKVLTERQKIFIVFMSAFCNCRDYIFTYVFTIWLWRRHG